MRQLLSVSLVLVLLLTSLTACADAQKTAAASEMPQSARQRGSGNMPQGERPTGERSTNASHTEGTQIRVRDSGAPASGIKNNNASGNGAEKTVTGKVKSIVGNEVVLIIAQDTDITDRKNSKSTAQTASQRVSDAAQLSEDTAQEVTETYLIPVGMAVGNKDFSAIKAGNTVRIYFGTDPGDGSEIITAVELR